VQRVFGALSAKQSIVSEHRIVMKAATKMLLGATLCALAWACSGDDHSSNDNDSSTSAGGTDSADAGGTSGNGDGTGASDSGDGDQGDGDMGDGDMGGSEPLGGSSGVGGELSGGAPGVGGDVSSGGEMGSGGDMGSGGTDPGPECGDGEVDPPETCDDGEITAGCDTYHDGGDGACVPPGECSEGYILDDPDCIPELLELTVEIHISNSCDVWTVPTSITVPPGQSVSITYWNRSSWYEADVWMSYGGGYLGLPEGSKWTDPIDRCTELFSYTAHADVSINGLGVGHPSCPGVRLYIYCE
jgi:hypothetical protein